MIRSISMIHVTKKIRIVDDPLSETNTPERLIAGIGARLTPGIDAGDCGGGFGTFAGDFFRVLVVVMGGWVRGEGVGDDLGKTGIKKPTPPQIFYLCLLQ